MKGLFIFVFALGFLFLTAVNWRPEAEAKPQPNREPAGTVNLALPVVEPSSH